MRCPPPSRGLKPFPPYVPGQRYRDLSAACAKPRGSPRTVLDFTAETDPRWREPDSNHRSRVTRQPFEAGSSQFACARGGVGVNDNRRARGPVPSWYRWSNPSPSRAESGADFLERAPSTWQALPRLRLSRDSPKRPINPFLLRPTFRMSWPITRCSSHTIRLLAAGVPCVPPQMRCASRASSSKAPGHCCR